MVIALVLGMLTSLQVSNTSAIAPSPATVSPAPVIATSVLPEVVPTAAAQPEVPANTVLGHFPYAEAPLDTLRPVSAEGIKLRAAAAQKFQEMVADARAEGVRLIPLSGFRTIADQNYLFFEVKAERNQTAQQRADVSAPPGYSEHHTGYAVDIADPSRRDLDLRPEFDTTPAFQWMQKNAARFSFELSFPKDNPQGVSYEPWHWRFVGDRDSLETFYKARSSSPAPITPVQVTPSAPLSTP
jgi:D-alanyl-D-alanine carboxypeptidase